MSKLIEWVYSHTLRLTLAEVLVHFAWMQLHWSVWTLLPIGLLIILRLLLWLRDFVFGCSGRADAKKRIYAITESFVSFIEAIDSHRGGMWLINIFILMAVLTLIGLIPAPYNTALILTAATFGGWMMAAITGIFFQPSGRTVLRD